MYQRLLSSPATVHKSISQAIPPGAFSSESSAHHNTFLPQLDAQYQKLTLDINLISIFLPLQVGAGASVRGKFRECNYEMSKLVN